jgi:hypothetical protein
VGGGRALRPLATIPAPRSALTIRLAADGINLNLISGEESHLRRDRPYKGGFWGVRDVSNMDDVALANYVAGTDRGPVEAGRLDAESARLLGVPCGTPIWFSDYTLIKLKAKHGEISFSHYRHMPSILLRGFLAIGRKPNLLDFWWLKGQEGFFLVLKATVNREIFVQTYHRIHVHEARRLYRLAVKQGRLIRAQLCTFLDFNLDG